MAGIVSLAGVTWEAAALCQPSAPVAVLQVHGDHDDTIPFSGTLSEPSAVRTVATWAMRDGCSGGLQDTGTTLDLDASLPGSETSVAAGIARPAPPSCGTSTAHSTSRTCASPSGATTSSTG